MTKKWPKDVITLSPIYGVPILRLARGPRYTASIQGAPKEGKTGTSRLQTVS
jgi:hypothetical protein